MQAHKIKLPNFSRTYEFIKRLAEYMTFGAIAQKFGKETATSEAWARVPESNENPFGNGKRNPIDAGLRVIALAHKEDAGLAREIAETSVDYCDYLDTLKGKKFEDLGGCVNELLAQSAKEHADIIVALLMSPDPDLDKVFREVKQAQSKLNELSECVKWKLKAEIQINFNESIAKTNGAARARG